MADMVILPLVAFIVIGYGLSMCNGRYGYIALSCFYNFTNAFGIAKLGGHIHEKVMKKLQIFEQIVEHIWEIC